MNYWRRQIAAIVRIDLAKTFFSKRGLWIYLLAVGPAVPMFLHGFFMRGAERVREDSARTRCRCSREYFSSFIFALQSSSAA